MYRLGILISVLASLSCSRELPSVIGTKNSTSFSSTNETVTTNVKPTEILETITHNTSPHFFKANYKVKVKVLFLEFCNSEIQLAVSAKLGMDGNPLFVMDKSVITCMFGIKLDLIKAMSGMAAKEQGNNGYNVPGNPNAPSSSQIFQKLIRLKKL